MPARVPDTWVPCPLASAKSASARYSRILRWVVDEKVRLPSTMKMLAAQLTAGSEKSQWLWSAAGGRGAGRGGEGGARAGRGQRNRLDVIRKGAHQNGGQAAGLQRSTRGRRPARGVMRHSPRPLSPMPMTWFSPVMPAAQRGWKAGSRSILPLAGAGLPDWVMQLAWRLSRRWRGSGVTQCAAGRSASHETTSPKCSAGTNTTALCAPPLTTWMRPPKRSFSGAAQSATAACPA